MVQIWRDHHEDPFYGLSRGDSNTLSGSSEETFKTSKMKFSLKNIIINGLIESI